MFLEQFFQMDDIFSNVVNLRLLLRALPFQMLHLLSHLFLLLNERRLLFILEFHNWLAVRVCGLQAVQELFNLLYFLGCHFLV